KWVSDGSLYGGPAAGLGVARCVHSGRIAVELIPVQIRERFDPTGLKPFTDLMGDELNVKQVELTDAIDTYGRFELTVNARVAGPRLGKDVQAAIKAVKAGAGVVNPDGTPTAGPTGLPPRENKPPPAAAHPAITPAP